MFVLKQSQIFPKNHSRIWGICMFKKEQVLQYYFLVSVGIIDVVLVDE